MWSAGAENGLPVTAALYGHDAMKMRFVRPGQTLADDDVLVRGGDLDQELVRADALRMFGIYGVFGISAFAACGVSLDELAQQPPLVRFARLTLLRVSVLRTSGLQLEATGRNACHFTIVMDDLDSGVEALCCCVREGWKNPYHEP